MKHAQALRAIISTTIIGGIYTLTSAIQVPGFGRAPGYLLLGGFGGGPVGGDRLVKLR